MKLQGVHGPGGAHLDLEADDVPAAVDGARGLGATVVAPHLDWAVMRSPGGQLFCLAALHVRHVSLMALVMGLHGHKTRKDPAERQALGNNHDHSRAFQPSRQGFLWFIAGGARSDSPGGPPFDVSHAERREGGPQNHGEYDDRPAHRRAPAHLASERAEPRPEHCVQGAASPPRSSLLARRRAGQQHLTTTGWSGVAAPRVGPASEPSPG